MGSFTNFTSTPRQIYQMKLTYRAEIDGLRAIAVLSVVFFHAGLNQFKGGFLGVDVFFVISGYLITNILLQDLKQNKFSILDFFHRRVRRILPALIFVMLVCIPFSFLWMLPYELQRFSESLLSSSFFASNFAFFSKKLGILD